MRTLPALAGLALAPVLVLGLTACGGSSDEPDAASTPSSDESASASPSASPSEEPAGSGSPQAFAGLMETLLAQETAVQQSDTPAEVNAAADFPEGVEITSLDKSAQSLCVQDTGQDISLTFSASDAAVVLFDGLCDGGEEVARLEPAADGGDTLERSGDEQVAAAVEKAFRAGIG